MKQAILMVSFGTSYNESRNCTIGAIESAVAERYPDYEIKRAFTSRIIINKLKKRDGIVIDTVEEALEKLKAQGVENVIVQPTHMMPGYEFDQLAAAANAYRSSFEKMAIGRPLLFDKNDMEAVAQILIDITKKYTKQYSDGNTAIVFMGHGTEHHANEVYHEMQKVLSRKAKHYYIGTVEAIPTVADVIELAKKEGCKRAILQPLMVVAGDHANNDMAGDEADSWKSQFQAAGIEPTCIVKGLGEFDLIQKLYISHIQDVKKSMDTQGTIAAAAKIDKENAPAQRKTQFVLPGEIEKRSFEIIAAELKERNIVLDKEKAPIICRAIHTTADFDYAHTLVFSDGALDKLKNLIRNGAGIVTDTNMALSGINKKTLAAFGGEATCLMADEMVARLAKEQKTTRAAVSMEIASSWNKPTIFVVGNAPTALMKLYEMYQKGQYKPAFIIGVPVGFVNVVEAKEEIMETDIPYIINKGRKGGSNVAAAICNAILYELSGRKCV